MLPLRGSSRGNGIRGMPRANKSVAVSAISLVLAIIVFLFGSWHCIHNSYKYSITCNADACKFKHNDHRNIEIPREISIPRGDIQLAEVVRINVAGAVVENSTNQKDLGYNLQLHVRSDRHPEIDHMMTFSPYDIGRGRARTASLKFSLYLKKKKHVVSFHNGKNVTYLGIFSIVASILSFILIAIYGQWADLPSKKVLKTL